MDTPLGKSTTYTDGYAPQLLAPMSRADARAAIGLAGPPPFRGVDVWNGYEFSWLNARGRPEVAGLRLVVGADSPRFVESKSLKLYLNGFAQTRFPDRSVVRAQLAHDLGASFGADVDVELIDLHALPRADLSLPGQSLDGLDIELAGYARNPDYLALTRGHEARVSEVLYTDLFRSLCPVTGQPDWASVLVVYQGIPIDRAGLLRYLVSYRTHPAFHETTIEQIYLDLKARCGCETLSVTGYFQRRGGLDINPTRTDSMPMPAPRRLPRQ